MHTGNSAESLSLADLEVLNAIGDRHAWPWSSATMDGETRGYFIYMERRLPNRSLRVAYFCPFLPFPASSGNRQRVLSLLDGLGRLGCRTTLLTLGLGEMAPNIAESAREHLARSGVERIEIYNLRSADFRLSRLLAWVARRLKGAPDVANETIAYSPMLARWFRHRIAAVAPDIIWMTYPTWNRLLDHSAHAGCIRVIEAQDLTTVLKPYLAEVERRLASVHWSALSHDAEILNEGFFDSLGLQPATAEFSAYDAYTHTVAINRIEANLIAAHAPRTHVIFQPMTSPVPAVVNSYEGPPVLVMARAGVNTLAFAYFVKRVVPQVRAAIPHFRVRIVGSGSDIAAGIPGFEYAGFLPDLSPEYAAARFAVVPTVGWTGQQVRVVEAMAHGLPVIALERTARSSPIVNEESGLVARDATEFAYHMIRLWNDPALCRRLGQSARKTVQKEYTQERLAEHLGAAILGRTTDRSDLG